MSRRLQGWGAVLLVASFLAAGCTANSSTTIASTDDSRAVPEVALDANVPTPVPSEVALDANVPTPVPSEGSEPTDVIEAVEDAASAAADALAEQADDAGGAGDEDADQRCGASESALEVAVFPDRWQVGEGRSIEIIKVDSDQPGITSVTPATVEVIEATDGGFVLRWTTGQTELEGASALEAQAFSLLGDLANGIAIEYSVSPDGWFEEVRNTEELIETMREAFALIDALEGGSRTPEERAQFSQVVESMITNPEFVNAIAVDAQNWHALYGDVYVPGDSYELQTMLPNALGGPEFPATANVTVQPLRDDGCLQVFIETRPDPDQFFDVLVESLGALAGDGEALEVTPEEAEMFADASIATMMTMVYDAGTGWPRELLTTSEISIGPTSQFESTRVVDRGPLDG